ncbi:MAG: RHS repeat-associated core domain-containing protein, partial [Bacteroidales bacterium]|nr:RHS repeat-associated core domain-containing protein [Bacteroidales bacterium]
RMYDPTVGRFLSPDPYVQDGTNPQNFNRYSYCLNNPLKYTDPSGYECEDLSGGESGLAMMEDKDFMFEAHLMDLAMGGGGGGISFDWGNAKSQAYGVYVLTDPRLLKDYLDSGKSLSEWVEQVDKNGGIRSYRVGELGDIAMDGGNGEFGSRGGMSFANNSRSVIGAGGVQVSVNCLLISTDVQIGETRNGKYYVSVSCGFCIGFGGSAGIFFSRYTPGRNTRIDYSPESMKGLFFSAESSCGLGVGYSSSIISPEQERKGEYHSWTTFSILMGTPGGNIGVGYTFSPFVFGK